MQWQPARATKRPRSGPQRRIRRRERPHWAEDPPALPTPRLRSSLQYRWVRPNDDRAVGPHHLQSITEFLRHAASINTVAHKLRLDEHDDLGALLGPCGGTEQISKDLDLVQARYSRLGLLPLLADQTSEQYGLSTGHGHGGVNASLRNGRSQGLLRRIDHIGDFLLDLQLDRSVRMYMRQDFQDDAGIAHLDGVDDWSICIGKNSSDAGRDGNLV